MEIPQNENNVAVANTRAENHQAAETRAVESSEVKIPAKTTEVEKPAEVCEAERHVTINHFESPKAELKTSKLFNAPNMEVRKVESFEELMSKQNNVQVENSMEVEQNNNNILEENSMQIEQNNNNIEEESSMEVDQNFDGNVQFDKFNEEICENEVVETEVIQENMNEFMTELVI